MVSVLKKQLIGAINIVSKAKDCKNPILYLSSDSHGLNIHYSGSVDYIVNIPATVEKPLNVGLTLNGLKETAKLCTDDVIQLSLDNGDFAIKSGINTFYMSTVSNPTVVDRIDFSSSSVDIPAFMFKKLVDLTAFYASPDSGRPLFQCCFLIIEGKNLSMIATDTHSISKKHFTMAIDSHIHQNFIVNAKALSDFAKIIDKKDECSNLTIRWNDKFFNFEYENVLMSVKKDFDKFPENIIPDSYYSVKNPEAEVSFKRSYLVDSLSRLLVLLKKVDEKPIRLSLDKEGIKITAYDPLDNLEVESTELIPAKCNNENYAIMFNCKRLLQCVKNLESDFCHMVFGDKFHPVFIENPNDNSFKSLVCPLRL